MKVLLLNQIPEVNNKYTFSMARGLKKAGVDITVCGIENDDVSAYRDIPFLNTFGCYSTEPSLVKKVASYRKSWRNIVDHCIKEKFDIVHVQWYIFSPLDWKYHRLLRRKGIKVVTTIHDLLPFNKKFYDFYFHKKIYSHSHKVISQARMNEKELVEKYGVSKEKIVYIPHGHYMEFADSASREESLAYLKLPHNRPVILFFGQIKKVKGVGVLITAMKDVVKNHPDALCLIAGKVWHDDFSEYQKLIDEFGLQENIRADIRFIADEEIKYYFNAADIVALPYLQIYQSGVVLLAYAYEKPVVATTEGEFLTVVKNGETGLLVPANNAVKFAEALDWYLNHPDKAHRFACEGKKDISERLSWDTIAKSLKETYANAR